MGTGFEYPTFTNTSIVIGLSGPPDGRRRLRADKDTPGFMGPRIQPPSLLRPRESHESNPE